jgi:hypothetical protein
VIDLITRLAGFFCTPVLTKRTQAIMPASHDRFWELHTLLGATAITSWVSRGGPFSSKTGVALGLHRERAPMGQSCGSSRRGVGSLLPHFPAKSRTPHGIGSPFTPTNKVKYLAECSMFRCSARSDANHNPRKNMRRSRIPGSLSLRRFRPLRSAEAWSREKAGTRPPLPGTG